MMSQIGVESFKNQLITSGCVLDPEGVHHEFVSGMHGQKLDFDNIANEDPLYAEWVDVTAAFVEEEYGVLPEVVLGVANGTNRLALDVARKFGGKMLGLVSAKDPENSKRLYLPDFTERTLSGISPGLVVVLEDVGTTGSNSVQVATAAAEWAAHVEVVATWQRREALERLDEANVPYRAVIRQSLPTFSPEACQTNPEGFCAQGWDFVPREK